MKKVLIFFFIIFISSCSSPGDVSIYKNLTTEELKLMVETDTLYESIYEGLDMLKKVSNKLDSVKFSGITYQMFYEYNIEGGDSIKWNPIKERYKSEWEKKYSKYNKKVDSISQYWKSKYENENSLENLIKVEPVGLKTEYYSYNSGVRNAYIRFKLTNISGKTISGVNFRYKIIAKVEDDGNEGVYAPKNDYDTSYLFDWNNCRSTAVFNNSTTGLWEVDYKYENIVGGKALQTLLQTHNIYVIPYRARVDNVNYEQFEYSDIPFEIRQYIKYIKEGDISMADLYKEDIINEYLEPGIEIPGVNDEFDNFFKEEMKKNHPLVSEFIETFSKKDSELLDSIYD